MDTLKARRPFVPSTPNLPSPMAVSAAAVVEDPDCPTEHDGEVQPLFPDSGAKLRPQGLPGLAQLFGWRLLAFLFCSQHLTRGFVDDLVKAAQKYIFREYGVAAPRMAMYDGVVQLPWALKPMIGVVADSFPIGGYSKKPYILFASILGIFALSVLGGLQHDGLTISGVVGLLFAVSLYLSTVDLLSEAVYAKELRARPASGPALLSYVWVGVDVFGMIAAPVAGIILVYWSPWILYRFAAAPVSCAVLPVVFNWMREPCLTEGQVVEQRGNVWKQREAVVLALIMLAATVLLSCTGMWLTVSQNACVTVAVLLIVILSFSLMLNPLLAKVNVFGLIQQALQVSLASASFYFMMDDAEEYPQGPHFSIRFYSIVLPVVGNVFSILGIWIYNKRAHRWTYQKMYTIGNLVGSFANILDIVLYLRVNTRIGVPDHVFVLGSTAIQDTMREWLWMPSAVLISHMCPKGMEAIIYANLAGCHNLGYTAAVNFGALLLERLHVEPMGVAQEKHQFDNLWLASLFSSLCPIIAVGFVPWFIPDKLGTEPIYEDVDSISANEGSLLRRWMGWGPPSGAGAAPEEGATTS